MTAGTLFDRRRTPLTVWFTACWMFATGKDGMSALSLQRALEIGLVNRVVSAADLPTAARDTALGLANLPTRAIGLTKRAFNHAVLPDLVAHLGIDIRQRLVEQHNASVARDGPR